MEDNLNLAYCASIWLAAAALIFYNKWKRGAIGCGLVWAYVLNLWLIHWPAAAIGLLPWYWTPRLDAVEAGFQQSTYAIVAFGVGSVIISPMLMRLLRFPRPKTISLKPEPKLPTMYLVIGCVCYSILLPLINQLPTITAVVYAGWNLLVVGLSLNCWSAWQQGKRKLFFWWLVVTLLLPFMTVITQGFLGYGTLAMMTVFTFVASFYRPRWRVIAIGAITGYLALSLYVTYMRDRSEIREIVWGGQSVVSRVDQLYSTISDAEFFDPYNNAHLQRIDDRLNQNYLVGVAVQGLSLNRWNYANGRTLWDALIALVPRGIWPDKPVFAGSGQLVTQYTGITFDETTSVGVGQVMEFYINFGTAGVVFGFLILGIVITMIDHAAADRLLKGDWPGFTLWFLPGLSFLQVGGSLVEVTSSAGAAIATVLIVNRYLLYRMRGKRLLPFLGKRRAFAPSQQRPATPSASVEHNG